MITVEQVAGHHPTGGDGRAALDAVLNPRSIALIGASPKPTSPARNVLRNLDALGFAGTVVAVNPGYSEVLGRPCIPSIADLREPADVAVVMLPAPAVAAAVDAAGNAGVRGAVVLTSDFAEGGREGRAYQRQLAATARRHAMALVGPNCMGNVSFHGRASTSFTMLFDTEPVRPGDVAVISQSGGIGAGIYALGVQSGLGFSYVISSGNESVLDLVDYVDYLVGDPHTRVICAYAEQIKRGRALLDAALRVRAAGKHLVVLKGGRGKTAARAAVSHTAAIATDDGVAADLFAEFGVVKVNTPADVVGVAQYLTSSKPVPRGNRVAVVTNTGGTAVLATDLAEEAGLSLPGLAAATRARLRAQLPPFAAVRNPVDLTGAIFNQTDKLGEVVDALTDDGGVDAVVLLGVLRATGSRAFAETMAPLLSTGPMPALGAWFAGGEDVATIFRAAGLAVYADPRLAMESLRRLVRANPETLPDSVQAASPVGPGPRRTITEDAVKRHLRAFGIEVPAEALAASADEARTVSRRTGLPAVVKIVSPDIPHRARLGLIELGLVSEDAVAESAGRLLQRASEVAPGARDVAVLVQRMVAVRDEVLIGISRDPAFGPLLTIGAGGTDVEELGAVVRTLLPLTPGGERVLVRRLATLAPLPPVALRQLEQFLKRLGRWWSACEAGIEELDLNPVVWTGSRLVVVDALAVVRGEWQGGRR